MKLSISTPAYNEKKYGQPHICIVRGRAQRTWGKWVGTPGSAGTLEIEVTPGDFIIHGQKDQLGRDAPVYGVVQADGSLLCMSRKQAMQTVQDAKLARAA